ncbi:hypothetical protein OIU79_001747 [Salix purpurea]|uniref:Uncharacterized protein n=1 Tax=Salix purpurea TaxID=77065 RepID=A0A9Q0UR27_SALPP|nr:hypothetical protein OIU79_001747 [Salix purpurea]KAJ6734539.1 hypothetical protein OIU79_001747 [Salix purpurea]
MVHGEEHSYWSIPFLELCCWKVIQSFSLLKGVAVLCFGILFNVALLSIPTTRDMKRRPGVMILTY